MGLVPSVVIVRKMLQSWEKEGGSNAMTQDPKTLKKANLRQNYKVCIDRFPIVAWASSGSHMSVQTQSRTSGMSSKCSRV